MCARWARQHLLGMGDRCCPDFGDAAGCEAAKGIRGIPAIASSRDRESAMTVVVTPEYGIASDPRAGGDVKTLDAAEALEVAVIPLNRPGLEVIAHRAPLS